MGYKIWKIVMVQKNSQKKITLKCLRIMIYYPTQKINGSSFKREETGTNKRTFPLAITHFPH